MMLNGKCVGCLFVDDKSGFIVDLDMNNFKMEYLSKFKKIAF